MVALESLVSRYTVVNSTEQVHKIKLRSQTWVMLGTKLIVYGLVSDMRLLSLIQNIWKFKKKKRTKLVDKIKFMGEY